MKAYKLIVLIILVILLQVGFLAAWRPFGVTPDLLLAVVISLALYTTASEALICAIAAGLALDLSSGADFGLRLGFYTVVALIVSLMNRAGVALDSAVWRLGLASLLVVMAHGVILIGMALHGVDLPLRIVATRLGAAIVLELGLIILVAPMVRRMAAGSEGLVMRGHR